MTHQLKRVLIIGGGYSGMAAAIELDRLGIGVDLVEIDAGWRSYGAGISLNGGTFRVMARLGILDAFRQVGAMTDGVEMRGPQDQIVARLPTPPSRKAPRGPAASCARNWPDCWLTRCGRVAPMSGSA
jgi:2-polyprenyl-6-methoxyphenol hydroxylase-like FAD-dependent oxidoreductase